MKVASQLSAENLAEHYRRLETKTVASTQVRVVSQPENSGSLDRTSDVSQSYQLQEADSSLSTGHCGQTARDFRLHGSYICCFSAIQIFNQ